MQIWGHELLHYHYQINKDQYEIKRTIMLTFRIFATLSA